MDVFKKKKTGFSKNHPTYIYKKVNDNYVYIGITHSPITNNTKNIKLSKNPDPTDNKVAYYIPEAKSDKVSSFGKKYSNWKMPEKDKKEIRKLKNK